MITKLKKHVKNNIWLSKLYRLYSHQLFFKKSFSKKIRGIGNKISIRNSSILANCKFEIKGDNNEIIISESTLLKNLRFYIIGNNNRIFISNNVMFFREGDLWIEDDNCEINIGKNSTFEQAHIAATESSSKISIGDDCMFAYEIDIRTGDSHSIFDITTKKRINQAKSIVIDNHVWVATHVSILKGVRISSNSIVATRSVVTKAFEKKNILIGGVPAKILKDNVTWGRERL